MMMRIEREGVGVGILCETPRHRHDMGTRQASTPTLGGVSKQKYTQTMQQCYSHPGLGCQTLPKSSGE